MASAWIIRRKTKSGTRYRVLYRVGGRESAHRYAGTFPTKAQALERRRWSQFDGSRQFDIRHSPVPLQKLKNHPILFVHVLPPTNETEPL